MLVTEPSHNLPWIVSQALEGGVTIVQWRQKSGIGAGFNRTYAGLCAVIQDAAPLMVNTVWEMAEKLHVPNVHLPEKSIPVTLARKLVGAKGLIGKSVHSAEAAIMAEQDGVDYVIAGTIFSSVSHPDVNPGGLELLSSIIRAVNIPVLAIGGITVDNLESCMDAGASGIAIMSPILQSKNPAAVARAYRLAMGKRTD
jgi:thiamine-phosphate diphosphorylase